MILSRSTTASLFVAVVLAAVAAWFVHQNVPWEGGSPRERFLFLGEIDLYETLEVEMGGVTLSCQRREGTWWITRPVSARADDEQIQRLLDTLAVAPIHDVISLDEQRIHEVSQRDYGLSNPQARIFLGGSVVPPIELRIGAAAIHGQGVYVGITGSPTVWVTGLELLAAIPGGIGDIRDRTLLPHPAARLRRFELRSPGAPLMAVENEADGSWWIKQPELRRADQDAVAALLSYVGATHILSFVHTPDGAAGLRRHPVDVGIPYGCTPDEASVIARFWFAGSRSGFEFHELLIGNPLPGSPDEVYLLSAEEGLVVTVPSTLLPALRMKTDDLRDRRVWPHDPGSVQRMSLQGETGSVVLRRSPSGGPWSLVEPIQAPANTEACSQLLEKLVRLTDIGMVDTNAPSRYDFLVELTLGSSPVVQTALVSRVSSEAETGFMEALDWYCPSSQTARRTDASALPGDFGKTSFFASLRDPVLLRIHDSSLAGVECHAGTNAMFKASLDSQGLWLALGVGAGTASSAVIERIALVVRELVALRVESLAAASLDEFGLRDAFCSLTFRFRDAEVPPRILLLGNPAPDGGRYAVLKGQDSVFVLSPEDTDVLTAPLRPQG